MAKITLTVVCKCLSRGKYCREERNKHTVFSSTIVILREEVLMETGPKLTVPDRLQGKPLNDRCGFTGSSSYSLICYDIESP